MALRKTDNSAGRPMAVGDFAKMLGQKLSDAGQDAAAAQAALTRLAISRDAELSRGDACRIMYALLQPRSRWKH
jgi:hypothetical protein